VALLAAGPLVLAALAFDALALVATRARRAALLLAIAALMPLGTAAALIGAANRMPLRATSVGACVVPRATGVVAIAAMPASAVVIAVAAPSRFRPSAERAGADVGPAGHRLAERGDDCCPGERATAFQGLPTAELTR
jgi:hypothetical protein